MTFELVWKKNTLYICVTTAQVDKLKRQVRQSNAGPFDIATIPWGGHLLQDYRALSSCPLVWFRHRGVAQTLATVGVGGEGEG